MSPSEVEQLWNEMRFESSDARAGTAPARHRHKMAAVLPYVWEEVMVVKGRWCAPAGSAFIHLSIHASGHGTTMSWHCCRCQANCVFL